MPGLKSAAEEGAQRPYCETGASPAVVEGRRAARRGGRASGGDPSDHTELGKAVSGKRRHVGKGTVSGQAASRASGQKAGGGAGLTGADPGARPA